MMSDRERDLLERATGELTAELAQDAAAQALPPGLAARIMAAGEAEVSGVTPLRAVGEGAAPPAGWAGWWRRRRCWRGCSWGARVAPSPR